MSSVPAMSVRRAVPVSHVSRLSARPPLTAAMLTHQSAAWDCASVRVASTKTAPMFRATVVRVGWCCVGCTASDQCPAEAAICDPGSRSCRGCRADDQCESGVCVEAEGICAADGSVIYVSSVGVDSGTCIAAAPCASLTFAIQFVDATRSIVHITGERLADIATITLTENMTIDGTGTRFNNPTSGPVFALAGGNIVVTIEGIQNRQHDRRNSDHRPGREGPQAFRQHPGQSQR